MPNKLSYDYVKTYISKFNYKLVSKDYKNSSTKLNVMCDKGHVFKVTFHNFKNAKSRCPVCCNSKKNVNRRYTVEEIRDAVEKEGYKLLSKTYKNSDQKLDLICQEGHDCSISWRNFRNGHRCKTCFGLRRGKNRRLKYSHVKQFIEKQGYRLLTKHYDGIYQKLDLICPERHNWSVSWANFANNNCRCSKCPTVASKGELEILNFIKYYFPDAVSGDREIIAPLELDIVIPSVKIAIEYCGLYWHSDKIRKNKNYHLNKYNLCKAKGYRLITIFEDEWENKKEIVSSSLAHILITSTVKSLYARKCRIENINAKEAREFCESNHLQGYVNSSIKLGLFYIDELVAVMTFGKPSISKSIKNNKDVYELTRFCIKNNLNVVGAAGKLFKYFLRNYNCKSILSYSDKRWFNGRLYKVLGFEKVHDSPPSYWYVINNSNKRYHRFTFRKSVLKKFANYDEKLTEREIMKQNGYSRIWDCGNSKWVYKNEK